MARNFAAGSYIKFGVGGLASIAQSASTMAAIVRRNANLSSDTIISFETASLSELTFFIGNSSDDLLRWCTQAGTADTIPISLTTAEGYALVAVNKAAGTVNPRGHKFVYGTNTWSHADSATTAPDTATISGGFVQIGRLYTVSTFDFVGDIAIVGAWTRSLSDAEIEQLAFSLHAWKSSAPDGLWLLDQSDTGQAVLDWSGGGSNQTSLTGTTVSTTSVPGFGYGHPVLILPTRPAVDADGSITVTAGLTGTASVDRPVAGNLAVTAAPTGAAAGARPITGDLVLTATGTATAALDLPALGDLTVTATTAADAARDVFTDGDLDLSADAFADMFADLPTEGDLPVTADALGAVSYETGAQGDITVTADFANALATQLFTDGDLDLAAVLGADVIAEFFAEGTLEILFDHGAEANIQFSDYLWYGAQVYETIQDRDRWYARLLDFVQATRGTSDYPVEEFGSGLSVADEATVGEDTGPTLYWSFRVSGELIDEAQVLAQEASDMALSGTTGTGQIVD